MLTHRWRWSCLAMSCGVLGTPAASADAPAQAPPPVAAPDFREVIQHAKAAVFPAVIYIKVIRESNDMGERKTMEVSGSGVIISPDGEALTNHHVIDKATQIRAQLSDGTDVDCTLVGSDKTVDLALIRLQLPPDRPSVPYARLGDSDRLQEGDFVMAMGAPWGLSRSVSIGIVSAVNRYLEDASEYSLWLQTDAAISPGNSGGPLVNTDGEVVGINTLGYIMGGDTAFSVPASTVRLIAEQLRASGEVAWSWTGLRLQPLRDFERDTYFAGSDGVIVAGTDPESPARRAGLATNDRIVRIAGEPVSAVFPEDLPAVRRRLGLLPIGEPVTLAVRRGGEEIEVELTPRKKGDVEGKELDCPRWDFAAKEINQFDNPDLYFHRRRGVFVHAVKHPGNAASAGLRENDIILAVDGEPVATLDDLARIHQAAIADVDRDHRAVFRVLRRGLMNQVVIDFLRDYSKR